MEWKRPRNYDVNLVKMLETEHGVKVTHPDKAAFIEKVAPMQVELAKELDLTDEYELLKN